MVRTLVVALLLTVAFTVKPFAAEPQEDGASAIKRLSFLAGSWRCTIKGGLSNGIVDRLSYEFSPDWTWMVERSDVRENSRQEWSLQVWGYDARQAKLVAYQFTPNGVFTKTVEGWLGNRFESQRDDNGASVSIEPIDANSFDWIIESADHSSIVTETCRR